jgi:O-antigen/teichoic acid export membrane protein
MTLNLYQIGRNAFSILTSDVMNRATTFVLYALVARHLGGREFGQLSLALTFFYTFQVLALGGMKTVIVREVAKEKADTSAYFVNGCVIVSLFSLAAIAGQWGFIRVMHYTPATSRFITLLSLGLVPYTLSGVCEGIFQAWERMHYIAYVNVPVNVAKIGAAFLLLSRNSGLDAIVLILLSSLAAIAAIELWILLRRFPALRGAFNLRFSLATTRSAFTFLGIDGIIAVMYSLNFLFLSKAATEVQVGLYNTATQVVTPLLLVYQSIAKGLFPVMCRTIEPGLHSLKRIAEQAVAVLLALALPAVTGLYFIGDRVISILYKNPVFVQAFPALRIIAWILILQVFTSVLGQVLVASHHESVTLRLVVVDALVSLVTGWPLIHYFGVPGAATAVLLTGLVDCVQHYIPVSRLLSGISLTKIAWKPVVAVSCMAAYLALTTSKGHWMTTAVSATMIYAAALFALATLAPGRLHELEIRFSGWRSAPVSGTHEETRS